MKKLDILFKIRYDLLSEIENNNLIKLRYSAVIEKDYNKVLFYNKQIDKLTEDIKYLEEINKEIQTERIAYNNYLIKNNKKDFYR